VIFNLAQLNADQLHSLQSLEEQTGRTILAFQTLPGEPAELSADDLARLQAAEKDLGLTLVAVDA
jgi:hypothetical protein